MPPSATGMLWPPPIASAESTTAMKEKLEPR